MATTLPIDPRIIAILADEAAAEMLSGGGGDKPATRLVLCDDENPKRDMGGYCKRAISMRFREFAEQCVRVCQAVNERNKRGA